jgi:putative Holliday junction resolvase
MALDYGSKRIGVAMSDELLLTAQGADTIFNNDSDRSIDAIKRLVSENEVTEIVVGLPINMDGSRGHKVSEVEAFVAHLAESIAIPVKTLDERLTTVQAERTLLEADMSRQKRRQLNDKIAAQLILQSYLDSRKKG